MTIRTLWVTNDFPPRSGGIEQYLANLLARREPSSSLVLTAEWDDAEDHDRRLPYRVERVGRRPLLPTPALLKTVRGAAEEHRADVVVFGASWPLAELASHLDHPTFALTYGHEAGMVRVGLGPLVRRVARKLDGLSVLSRFTHDVLAPCIDGCTKVYELPAGVDGAVFHAGIDGSYIRQRHGISADTPLVLCVGRLVPRKGQDTLVESWPGVQAHVPDAKLLLVGTGPRENELRRRIEALDLHTDVIMAGEAIYEDLPAYYAAADLFAMPCRTLTAGLDVEGLGLVYLEAQATGTPVVAGRSGGAPEALIEGETGRLVDGTDEEEVAATIAKMLSDPDELSRMAAAGRTFVERRYSWEVISGQLDAILREVAARR